jgi:hypothetical protein
MVWRWKNCAPEARIGADAGMTPQLAPRLFGMDSQGLA